MHKKITLHALEVLLQNRFKEGFLSLKDLPHPSTFKDMDRATLRIVDAIEKKEKIMIIGDYDVDGITATTLMKLFFEEIETAVEWMIPNRFHDGYGLSESILDRVPHTDLLITVDNGIAAVEAAKVCKARGIELIITDHHLLPPKVPEAYAIINQKQEACQFPYDEVCGAQIAWYLIASLKNALGVTIDMMAYMELVALAIIADMMPLQHINRVMVVAGLQHLSQSQRPAIRAYREYSQKEHFSAEDVGFFLAPLLNSAGRMDDAAHAVAFLSASNIYDARVRLERLIAFNTQRKETESDMTKKALAGVHTGDGVLVLAGEAWHEGVVGIVAARIAEIHQKPTIILSRNGEGLLKGSGRSFESCDLFAITNECRELLEKFGGHAAAIGLSLKAEKIELFRKKLQQVYHHKRYEKQTVDPEIVGEIAFGELSFALTALIAQYEPYGMANARPKFMSTDVRIVDVTTMGKEGNHLRFTFEQGGYHFTGVKFKTEETFEPQSSVTIVYHLHENHFRGRVTLQLMVDTISIDNMK